MGICKIDYETEDRIWTNRFGEFPYKFVRPIRSVLQCFFKIESGTYKHEGAHKCNTNMHTCTN